MKRRSWLEPFGELTARQRWLFGLGSFLIPLGIWCAISYLPFLWHPMMRVVDPGDITCLWPGQLVERAVSESENAAIVSEGCRPAMGVRANRLWILCGTCRRSEETANKFRTVA